MSPPLDVWGGAGEWSPTSCALAVRAVVPATGVLGRLTRQELVPRCDDTAQVLLGGIACPLRVARCDGLCDVVVLVHGLERFRRVAGPFAVGVAQEAVDRA